MTNRGLFIFLFLLFAEFSSLASEPVVDDTLKANQNSKFLAFPFFLKSPETDWGFGGVGVYFFKAKKNDRKIRTSDINLVSLYTLRQQVVVVLGSTIFFPGEKEILRFQSSYSVYPDKFWGIGNNSPAEAEEDYSLHQFYFNPQFLRKIFWNWYAGIGYEFQHVGDFEYVANGVFDQQNVTGRNGGSVSGLGLLLTWDTRNNAYYPSKGSFAELGGTSYSKGFGSDFDFSALTIDLRKYVLLSVNSVLSMQLFVRDNTGDVPVRQLSLLGGPEIMRGYYKGRFADKDMFACQAEIRHFLFWRIGVTGFGSLGEVSQTVHQLSLNGLHYAGGAGVRIMVDRSEKLNLRIDYGFGEGSHGVYVILKEAF
jgi:hypothetical protein